ncbi:hypothetical protein [Paraclostridium dentum]|uniref:hypothetical protein n=1 Tax=Paraclostridium dentum TaxID=2662455 RepID=UPI003F2E97D3
MKKFFKPRDIAISSATVVVVLLLVRVFLTIVTNAVHNNSLQYMNTETDSDFELFIRIIKQNGNFVVSGNALVFLYFIMIIFSLIFTFALFLMNKKNDKNKE